MAYGPANPAYVQAQAYGPIQQPGFQPPPQYMAYGPADPAYVQAQAYGPAQQPGVQPPPQGMAHGPADPAYAQAQGIDPADMNAASYGRIADVVNDIANGGQPDVNKIVSLFSGFDTQFWKGALIGALVTVLLTNDTVKGAVSGTMAGIFNAFKKEDGTVEEG
jgi:hypothetical protein